MKKLFLMFWLLLLPLASQAQAPLPAAQAFAFSAQLAHKNTLVASWKIAPGYYLYREHFSFSVITPATKTRFGAITLPAGIAKQDEILGKYQVYENALTLQVPLLNPPTTGQLIVSVGYQGCAIFGFCYPPVTKQITLIFTPVAATAVINAQAPITQSITSPNVAPVTPQDTAKQLLASHNWLFIIAGFFGFGLLLTFTPCVLPLLPILAGIIVGQGRVLTTAHAFGLSLAYVLGMAVTYAIAGVLAALAGNYVQATLQNPWVLGAFSLVFIALALSLFGLYELRLPNQLEENVTALSNRQRGGTYIGVIVMGCLSVLIVSPCVTAPLIGALSYIGNTGDMLLGGTALFAMGLGMGLPLLIVGTTGGKFLPKAGPWLNAVKAFFGMLLLGAALWLLERILPVQLSMLLWSALAIFAAIYLGALTTTEAHGWKNFWRGLGVILLIYGVLILVGGFQGNTNPLEPLIFKTTSTNNIAEMNQPAFQTIKTVQDLQQALANARLQNKPVLLDFYATWCVSCQQMARYTFSASKVQTALRQFVLLRADVTANDAFDQALEKQFNIIAPPAIVFFNSKGTELTAYRVVGEMNAQTFLQQLQQVQQAL